MSSFGTGMASDESETTGPGKTTPPSLPSVQIFHGAQTKGLDAFDTAQPLKGPPIVGEKTAAPDTPV
jgi:hypothetical protein